MGLVQYPRLEYHWSKTLLYNCSLCPSVMTKKDFFLLHGFLHFADNRNSNLDDKIYKVRKLFELLSGRFHQYYTLNWDLTIDERIVKFTGRLSFLQYIRNKPNQYRIKMYILADAHTGYVYNWKVYTGSQDRKNQVKVPNQNSQVIITLEVKNLTLKFITQSLSSIIKLQILVILFALIHIMHIFKLFSIWSEKILSTRYS